MKNTKLFLCLRVAVSVAVLVFAALQLLHVWDGAIHIAMPLFGVLMLLRAADEWHSRRSVALVNLCAAVFIFLCAIGVFFF